MTLHMTQSNTAYNTCYDGHASSRAEYNPRTVGFLLLVLILAAETVITAALLYSFTRELHTTAKSLDQDIFPTECLYQHGLYPAAMHPGGLESCNLMWQELQNSMNTRLLLDIRNTLWQSLGEHNITQVFKPAIHVGIKQELNQYQHLQRRDDPQLTLDCINWEVLSSQSTQEGLMILSPDGDIVIPQDGIYFVYSQINYISSHLGPDLNLLQYLFKKKSSRPEPEMLGKAGASRHIDPESSMGMYSIHQGALFQLERGDRLSLCVTNMDAVLIQPEATYFGAFILD